MSRGGKRDGSGRKPNSGQFNGPTKPVRLPEHLEKDRRAIVDVDLYLQQIMQDFSWLAETLPEMLKLLQAQEVKVVRFSKPSKKATKVPSIYRKHMIPVAATLDLVPLSSDFDESTYEEIDLLKEFGDPDVTIFLTVRGESMIDAGIEPGDELVVEVINYPMRTPNHGDFIIASLDGRVTVKEFHQVNNKAFLVPHNENLEQTEITDNVDFHVYGIVRKQIRSFKKRRF
jgi:DNA polymerase V